MQIPGTESRTKEDRSCEVKCACGHALTTPRPGQGRAEQAQSTRGDDMPEVKRATVGRRPMGKGTPWDEGRATGRAYLAASTA